MPYNQSYSKESFPTNTGITCETEERHPSFTKNISIIIVKELDFTHAIPS